MMAARTGRRRRLLADCDLGRDTAQRTRQQIDDQQQGKTNSNHKTSLSEKISVRNVEPRYPSPLEPVSPWTPSEYLSQSSESRFKGGWLTLFEVAVSGNPQRKQGKTDLEWSLAHALTLRVTITLVFQPKAACHNRRSTHSRPTGVSSLASVNILEKRNDQAERLIPLYR